MELIFHVNSLMLQMVTICDSLIVVFTACVGVYTAPRRMREMLKFLESVALMDKNISAQFSAAKERKLCGLTFAVLILFSILVMYDFCCHIMHPGNLGKQWDVVANLIGFYILWYVVLTLELQFALTALSVHKRFQAVNDSLVLTAKHVSESLNKCNEPRPTNMSVIYASSTESQWPETDNLWMDSSQLPRPDHSVIIKKSNSGEPQLLVPPCEAIRQLSLLHDTLCEIIQRINDSYGLPLIVILISILVYFIVVPYYWVIATVLSKNEVHNFVLLCLWSVVYALGLFVIIESCHLTVAENKKTQELVCDLMTHVPSSGVLPSRLLLFSQQLMLRSAAYSPLGICIFDRPLIVSVIGTVTTYLVILLQFQQNDADV